jgi:ribosomal protein S18 acetylase RimI-like enzyme
VTITSIRIATAEDAQLVADVINAHELGVDPANSSMSAEGALEFMRGYVDQSETYLLSIDDEPDFSVAINLHPDQARKKFFADVYAMPKVRNLNEVTSWVVHQAESEHPDWDICPGVNSLDDRLQSAWSSEGFEFLRRYHTMRVQLNRAPEALQSPGVEIRSINLSDQALVTKWYESHQDSFANHFGFVPRTLENWRELTLGGNLIDSEGVFLAFKDGEVAGYCQCTDEYAHDAKGFISLLGVNHQYQGFGIGEALLRAGLAHSFAKGYKVVELNVDTGNESGALRLYEKIGFEAESSWIQMHRYKAK